MKTALAPSSQPLELSAQRVSTNKTVTPADLSGTLGAAKAPADTHTKLVKQTQNWVAQTFFATLLKQMRESPFKSDLFSGGEGGKSFGSLYDQELSQRMARGSGTKLVNSIVKRIEANAAYRKSIQPTAQSQGEAADQGSSQSNNSSNSGRKGQVSRVSTAR